MYSSEMAQNFWTAIWAWTTCFVVTIVVSLLTRPKPDDELRGLVYSLTPRLSDEGLSWYQKPGIVAIGVLILILGLNLVFM